MSRPPKNARGSRHEALIDGVPVRSLPKVSLHDHLDGGVRAATVLELARERGIETPADTAGALADWFAETADSGSLEDYIATFDLTIAVMQTAEALTRIAREYVLDLANDGVIYGEVRWAPEQHLEGGLTLDEAVQAVQDGLEEGEDEAEDGGHSIRVGQILSAMRQSDRSAEIARLALEFRDAGVVAFDLAGPEDGFPPSRHADALDLLAREFFPVTLHAGEAAGLDSIRGALLDGRALRLGHGVRIAEDLEEIETEGDEVHVQFGELARWVRDREIPLELSPSSNLGTGAIAAWGTTMEDHPFDLLYQLGFCVTVNTDNRLMSRTTLTREISRLAEAFDYDLDDVEQFQINAASATFLPVEQREELIDLISEGFDR
ncbi:adenosine deaminase [Microbacterium sp. ZXX196]|uniref:adenosine deaminase n=1 Tax=Microbacterium sp. ZXX196 TaxID=2609291 RepID=UPI0012B8F64A|nr:adenosine deaminase [Microbacterium sp. ZXX196]MTE22702.1 adenosine deaminase [Microbacterium sp. ZXX196]